MQVVQSHPVPYFALLYLGRERITDLCKSSLQCQQTLELLGRCGKWNTNERIHIGSEYSSSYMNISSTFAKNSKRTMAGGVIDFHRAKKVFANECSKTLPHYIFRLFFEHAHRHVLTNSLIQLTEPVATSRHASVLNHVPAQHQGPQQSHESVDSSNPCHGRFPLNIQQEPIHNW